MNFEDEVEKMPQDEDEIIKQRIERLFDDVDDVKNVTMLIQNINKFKVNE